jgi:hypothetical protein
LDSTGGAALLLGLLISPMAARVLPSGWDGHVAACIMSADRWQAGVALMAAESPEAWRIWSSAAEVQKSNAAASAACRDAAAKAKKAQRCGVMVTAP